VQQISRIDLKEVSTAIPAFLILVMIPLTYSISHGIGIGLVAYVIIRMAEGRLGDVHPLMYVTALAFALHLLWG